MLTYGDELPASSFFRDSSVLFVCSETLEAMSSLRPTMKTTNHANGTNELSSDP